MDFAYYGNTVSNSAIMGIVNPNKDLFRDTLILLAIFAVAAFPRYFVTAFTIDRLGRKGIQIPGFLAMALAFGLLARQRSLERRSRRRALLASRRDPTGRRCQVEAEL